MYKNIVDYYDYTTLLYSVYTCNKLHIETVSHVGRGFHTLGKLTLGKVRFTCRETHVGASSRVGKVNVGRGSLIGKRSSGQDD